MRKYLLTILTMMAVTTVSAQGVKIYEYDEYGNLSSTPIFSTNKKVKIVFDKVVEPFMNQNLVIGSKVEGQVIVNGDTITKTIGGVVPEYVDLGMRGPNGEKILWATRNLGATNPEDMGAYICFAELGDAESGYVNGIKDPISNYSAATTKYLNPKNGKVQKYCNSTAAGDAAFMDDKNELDSCDDAATVNLGAKWRTPSYFEMEALINTKSFTWEYTGDGYNVISKIAGYEGNSIFLPLTGYINGQEITSQGTMGYYMTCTQVEGKEMCLKCNPTVSSKKLKTVALNRYCGLAIRPVRIE